MSNTKVFDTLVNPEHEKVYFDRENIKNTILGEMKEIVDSFIPINEVINFIPNVLNQVGSVISAASDVKSKLKSSVKFFDGSWNIVSPDYRLEETWHDTLNNTMDSINSYTEKTINGMLSYLKEIPAIGDAIGNLGSISDISIDIKLNIDNLIKNPIDDIKSVINNVKSISVTNFIKDIKEYNVIIPEFDLVRTIDIKKINLEEMRKSLSLSFVKKIKGILDAAPSFIFDLFKPVKVIFDGISKLVNIINKPIKDISI